MILSHNRDAAALLGSNHQNLQSELSNSDIVQPNHKSCPIVGKIQQQQQPSPTKFNSSLLDNQIVHNLPKPEIMESYQSKSSSGMDYLWKLAQAILMSKHYNNNDAHLMSTSSINPNTLSMRVQTQLDLLALNQEFISKHKVSSQP